MSGLREGDEVTVFCQICATPINPTTNYKGRVCGRECSDELQWRETLSVSQGAIGPYRGFARYKVHPDLIAAAKKQLGIDEAPNE